MALRDLMWGCPLCGQEGRLRSRGRTTLCNACGGSFRRGQGATILARRRGGAAEAASTACWLDRTPPPAEPAAAATLGPERVIVRMAEAAVQIRTAGEFVGWGERFGPKRAGVASLSPTALLFQDDRGTSYSWPLERVTAVQPTASSLQVKTSDAPVAYFRFLESSVRRWEHWIQYRLRILFRDAGKGEIVEFQPRISTR